MTIFDVENIYNRFGAVHSCIFSNFKQCSIDTNQTPNYYLVDNLTKCFDFDLVKDNIAKKFDYSVDSLFVSIKMDTVFFVEFKNSYFNGSYHKATRKAFCSIHIHDAMCGFSDYSFCKNVLCFVISVSKENTFLARKGGLTAAMLRVAHYTIDESYKKDLNERFMEHIISKSSSSLPFLYDECKVVFDNDFDDFVSMIV